MSNDATSLDRLHDIVEPPPVPWWPPAPGWYVVLAAACLLLTWLVFRSWQHWKANAYRRAAVRELSAAQTSADVSELLRRTALAVAPRSQLASLTGAKWPEWLEASMNENMPPAVKEQLSGAMYDPTDKSGDIAAVRDYAECWIRQHKLSDKTVHGTTTSDSRC